MSVWVSTFLDQFRAEGSEERGLEIKVHAALVVERGGAQIGSQQGLQKRKYLGQACLYVCVHACMDGRMEYGCVQTYVHLETRNLPSSPFKSGFP